MHFFIVSIPTHNTLAVLRSEDTTIDVRIDSCSQRLFLHRLCEGVSAVVDSSSADVHVENAVVVIFVVIFDRFYHYK